MLWPSAAGAAGTTCWGLGEPASFATSFAGAAATSTQFIFLVITAQNYQSVKPTRLSIDGHKHDHQKHYGEQ